MKIAKPLTLFAGLLALGACGGGGSEGGKVNITVGFWPLNSDTKDVAMYMEWKEAFERDNPQYTITAQPYTYSKETIATIGGTARMPTVIQTWFTEPEYLVGEGFIRDISEELKEMGWDEKIDEEMKSNIYFDGKYYGIPRDGYGLGLMINKKILGENGLLREVEDASGNITYSIYDEDGKPLYPTTFDQIRQYSETIAEYSDAKGILILSDNKEGGWQFSNLVWNFGGTIEKQGADGKWTADLTSDAAVNALEWIRGMKADELLLMNAVQTYNSWYDKISSQVAMAIVGSDQIHLIATQGSQDIDDYAFVPMPSVNSSVKGYSLYGGTPYVFSSRASDEQVIGAMKFLEYIGRSPETGEISRSGIEKGYQVSREKGQPILPTLRPWVNQDYVEMVDEIEAEYLNVNMEDFKEFFDKIDENKHVEEPYYAQDLYEVLDGVIQTVLSDPYTANCANLLATAEATFNSRYLSELNK